MGVEQKRFWYHPWWCLDEQAQSCHYFQLIDTALALVKQLWRIFTAYTASLIFWTPRTIWHPTWNILSKGSSRLSIKISKKLLIHIVIIIFFDLMWWFNNSCAASPAHTPKSYQCTKVIATHIARCLCAWIDILRAIVAMSAMIVVAFLDFISLWI